MAADVKDIANYKALFMAPDEKKPARVLITFADTLHFYVYRRDKKLRSGKMWSKDKDFTFTNKNYVLHIGYKLAAPFLPKKPTVKNENQLSLI